MPQRTAKTPVTPTSTFLAAPRLPISFVPRLWRLTPHTSVPDEGKTSSPEQECHTSQRRKRCAPLQYKRGGEEAHANVPHAHRFYIYLLYIYIYIYVKWATQRVLPNLFFALLMKFISSFVSSLCESAEQSCVWSSHHPSAHVFHSSDEFLTQLVLCGLLL